VPHLRRAGSRGDLHVFVNVVVPERLSKRQRELLAQYAAESGEAVSEPHPGLLGKVRDALG
jgi:molecular chaperone DnaJ